MSKRYDSVLELVGRTPIVRLNRLPDPGGARVWAKLEYFNPGGSVKDRIGLGMVEDFEEKGVLKPGGTIVEGTSGNTGVGLALAGLLKGYRVICVMPDKISLEKRALLRAYGAEVVITPTNVPPDSPENYLKVTDAIARDIPGAVVPRQHFNQSNPEVHYRTTGPEIWEQMEGKVDVFVGAIATGGTISGVGRYLKEKNPDVRIIGADPVGSILKVYLETGRVTEGSVYLVEGAGEDFIPTAWWKEFTDEIRNVTDKEAFQMSRRLGREEGILCGGSAGLTGHVAMQVAAELSPDHDVVFIVPDDGQRYLSKHHSDEWMRQMRMLAPERMTLSTLLDTKGGDTPALVSAHPDQTVAQALKLMSDHAFSQLPVLDGQQNLGSVREATLLGSALENGGILDAPVSGMMEPAFPVLDGDSHADHARELLREHPAVLVQERGKLRGLLTRHDLLSL